MNSLQTYDRDWLSDYSRLIGIDEAGRGSLAGPVVAGACVFSQKLFESHRTRLRKARSSTTPSNCPLNRASLSLQSWNRCKLEGLIDFAVASGSVAEIALHNIIGATRLAMQRAIEQLAQQADGWSLYLIWLPLTRSLWQLLE